jgi:uncharacterized protein (DUF983 family)
MRDWESEELDDNDWDDDPEAEIDSADEGIVACPYCGAEMFEDAPQCAACGNYISVEDHPAAPKPTWIVVTAVLCLIMALGWVLSS